MWCTGFVSPFSEHIKLFQIEIKDFSSCTTAENIIVDKVWDFIFFKSIHSTASLSMYDGASFIHSYKLEIRH